MNKVAKHQLCLVFAGVASLLMLSACQSIPGNGATGNSAIPGNDTEQGYSYIVSAIKALDKALSGRQADFTQVPLGNEIVSTGSALPQAGQTEGTLQNVRALIETKLLAPGPYQLVQANMESGRIEYRSKHTNSNLSITVRPANVHEKSDKDTFIVKDIFSQVSLIELLHSIDSEPEFYLKTGMLSADGRGLLKAGIIKADNDAALLAYYNALPMAERGREDLLTQRALLNIRLGRYQQALPLVEQGIVRYQQSVIFYSMANAIIEHLDAETDASKALGKVVDQRFTKREFSASKKWLQGFIDSAA